MSFQATVKILSTLRKPGSKSKNNYELANKLTKSFQSVSITGIRKLLKLGHKSAKQLKLGALHRQQRSDKISNETDTLIQEFFMRDDISRPLPDKKYVTKKVDLAV